MEGKLIFKSYYSYYIAAKSLDANYKTGISKTGVEKSTYEAIYYSVMPAQNRNWNMYTVLSLVIGSMQNCTKYKSLSQVETIVAQKKTHIAK